MRLLIRIRSMICGAALAMSACSEAPQLRGLQPGPSSNTEKGIKEISAVVIPKNAPLEYYGGEIEHTLFAGETLLKERLSDLDLRHDPRLSRMIRSLARVVPSRFDMPPELVDGLMAWNGLLSPPPSVVIVELERDPDACALRSEGPCLEIYDALVEEIERSIQGREHLYFGVGIDSAASGATRLVVGMVEHGIELLPIPVRLEVGETFVLKGRVLGDRTLPRIEIVDPKGHQFQHPATVGDDGSIHATLRCNRGRGRYQVEVLADGKLGPEIVANFPIDCGVSAPSKLRFSYERLEQSVSVADIVESNFSYMNEARKERGLAPLGWDGAAGAVAEAHSQDMVRHHFMGHISPTKGDVTRRFARAKLESLVIRENVARGYGPLGIHQSLMNSPGHRANILATDVTHVGIGVVFGRPETDAEGAPRPVFLTQNFRTKPDTRTLKDFSTEIMSQVEQSRKQAGLSPLRLVRKASQLAQARAEGLAHAQAVLSDDDLAEQLFSLGFKTVDRRQINSNDWRAFSTADFWQQEGLAQLGVGIAEVSKQAGGGFVMVVLMDSSD